MAEAQERGRYFETKVEDLFLAAGFQVDARRELRGQEWDLIASRQAKGGFLMRIAVECKSRKRTVSNADINKFVHAFEAHRQRLGFTHGVIVTDRDFSRSASEAGHDIHHVRLVSFKALESELIGSHLYLNGAIRNYRSQIRRRLIDPPAEELIGNELVPVTGIIDRLLRTLTEEQESFTFLLGDFGSGKTTVAEQTHKALADCYLESGGESFPFLFYLRNLAQFDTDRAFIEAQLSQQSSEVGYELFNRMQCNGKSILILDGLDEVATHASQEERFRLFSRVMRISQSANHLLISSRPTHFNNLLELNGLIRNLASRDFRPAAPPASGTRNMGKLEAAVQGLAASAPRRGGGTAYRLFSPWNTRLFYIRPFTKENIIAYLSDFEIEFREHQNHTVDEIYEFLSNIYDLSDLITRPLLLEMLVELIIQPNVLKLDDPDLQVGPAELYKLYVEYHLNRDYTVRQFLMRHERRQFARAAALAMLDGGGSLVATYESVERIVLAGMRDIERASHLRDQMTEVVNDVRICAFMNVTANDRIEFSHKSFMEYFVAEQIVEKLGERKSIPELDRPLNYEILYFVGAHCINNLDNSINLRDHLLHLDAPSSALYGSNVRMARLYAEHVSEVKTFSDIFLNRALIKRHQFIRCWFERVTLSTLTIDGVTFDRCEFVDTSLTGKWTDSSLLDCKGALELGPLVQKGTINNSTLQLLAHDSDLRIDGGTINGSELYIRSNTTTLANLNVKDSTLKIEGGGYVELETSTLANSALVRAGVSAPGVAPPVLTIKSRLEECLVTGFRLRAEAYETAAAALRSCYGILLVQGTRAALANISGSRHDLGKGLPKCLVEGRMLYVLGNPSGAVEFGHPELCDLVKVGKISEARRWLARAMKGESV